MRRVVIATVAAVVLMSGCGAAKPGATGSGSTTGGRGAGSTSPSASSAVPSVAPGTVVDAKEFTGQLRTAMQSATSYEYDTVSLIRTQQGDRRSNVHTIVNQVDLNATRVRTDANSGEAQTVIIMIGDTQYTKLASGKYRKATVPQQSAATYVSVGLDLENGAKSVTYVGPEKLEARDVRHYTADLLPQDGGSEDGSEPGETLKCDLWLDARGRLLKSTTRGRILDNTLTYGKYDTAAPVTEPAASEIES